MNVIMKKYKKAQNTVMKSSIWFKIIILVLLY